MTGLVRAVVLVLLGATALRLVTSGQHLSLVKPSLGPWVLLAGGALVALGVAAGAYALGTDDEGAADEGSADEGAGDDADADGHGHGHGGPRVGLLLLLPVMVLLVAAPPPLGSYAAERGRAPVPAELPEAEALRLPAPGPDGYRPTTLTDYTARAHHGSEPSYEGEPVTLTGFVTPRPGGGWFLTRMTLACCAADGAPLKVLVRGAGPAPARDTWVRVDGRGVGTVDPALRAQDALGEVVAERVTVVPEPDRPYE